MSDPIPIVDRRDQAREPESVRRAASFSALVERHTQWLMRLAITVTRNAHDAEDAVQEAFLAVYRDGRWREWRDERGYLARVVWRLAVRQTRPRLREQELSGEWVSSQASPEQRAEGAQTSAWLQSRIDALPEKLRQPLVLAALGDLKLVEIANILDLPEGTVRRRVHEARNRLREELSERNGA